MFHKFASDISGIELPEHFNNPFRYTPHRLAVIAADEVRHYVASHSSLSNEVAQGKMFGVLVVRNIMGEIGFLTAFSGLLAGSNSLPFFVPAVYDMLYPGGYFKQEEGAISLISKNIESLLGSESYLNASEALMRCRSAAEGELSAMRKNMRDAKSRRDALRRSATLDADTKEALIRESQYQKAEAKRLAKKWQEKIQECEARLNAINMQVALLKEERRQRSAELQRWLFTQFAMLNAKGETKTLLQIFDEHSSAMPPAGAGECAAPKMLQYAYAHKMQPLCMAEFWIGASPVGEVRRDGCYYASCKGKCGPILGFMLQGLQVDDSSSENVDDCIKPSAIIYEDDFMLIVNKPPGLLSVPGIVGGCSVQEWLCNHFPDKEFYVVHRLDMSTSGLLLVAKTPYIYKVLQGQFAKREVAKMYIALLDGLPQCPDGDINLPLSPDYINRPSQMVDFEHGKEALTHYKIIDVKMYNGKQCAVAELYPLTGRTHQLRVHCAHIKGLDTPIVGDELYGTPAGRLMLHAAKITFRHPVTGEDMEIFLPADFKGLFS